MDTNGGGWTVFQRRQDGSVKFYENRFWAEYEKGFGALDNEFWLGLSKIHRLTKIDSSLRVDMEDFERNTQYAQYDTFSVGDISTNYQLTVNGFSGTDIAGDSLKTHDGMEFSTDDVDNDEASLNCARKYSGAWWYKECINSGSNLNGLYKGGASYFADGVVWSSWKGYDYSLKFVEMKLRDRK